MKLGIIINCMGKDKNSARDIETEYLTTVDNILRDEIGFDDVQPLFPDETWKFSPVTQNHEDFPKTDTKRIIKIREKNNKGQVVTESLKRLNEHKVDIVIHIDGGSRRFDLKSIIDIATYYLEPSFESVLTNRDWSGMDKWREVSEKFERMLVKSIFTDKEIHDGQSGCWSFRVKNGDLDIDDSTHGIYITAEGYEIELDVLTELLRLNRKIFWSPIKVKKGVPTQYEVGMCIGKILFICKKLGIKKENMLSILHKFEKLESKLIKDAEDDPESKKAGWSFSNYKDNLEELTL